MTFQTKILNDRKVRTELAKRDLRYFFSLYFSDYIKVPSAPFHQDIIKILQNDRIHLAAIVAFRGSGKSTLCSHVFPLWSIFGAHQKHYAVIVCQNQNRAQEVLGNIRRALTGNQLLQNDFGPFQGSDDPSNSGEIILGKYDAKISAISISQGIRGTIYNSYRPDVIICDDIEDVPSTKTTESRDKTWELVNSEILNLGQKDPRVIFIGNLIHNDSTMMRLRERILNRKMKGVYRAYPLLDENDQTMWPGMYPTAGSIADLRARIGSEIDFLREYMLQIPPEGGQVVTPDMINYYDVLPAEDPTLEIIVVDPAFSEERHADKTAILRLKIFGSYQNARLYVCPFPYNNRQRQPDIVEEIKQMYFASDNRFHTRIIVEQAGQQKGLIDTLINDGLPAIGVPIGSVDKRQRLSNASGYMNSMRVFFPKKGEEELINQILYYGTERYDDLMDAFTLGVQYFASEIFKPEPGIIGFMREEYGRSSKS